MKAGQIVLETPADGLFYYKLQQYDIECIESGEWKERNWKITSKFKETVNCLVFSILPFWCYERKKHYQSTYWQHLIINLVYLKYLLKIK